MWAVWSAGQPVTSAQNVARMLTGCVFMIVAKMTKSTYKVPLKFPPNLKPPIADKLLNVFWNNTFLDKINCLILYKCNDFLKNESFF